MDGTKRKKDLSTTANHETAMDAFLKKLGLYRKAIAKDGSCLFRAVAEQVFKSQAEHPRLRKECIEFMKRNKEKFEAFVEGPFDHHLFGLSSQKGWAGQVEIHALSLMYKCDFLVYQMVDSPPINATENNYDKKVMLCYSNGNHYDSVYPFSHQKNLALCQSIVFELLYGNVFRKLAATEQVNKSADMIERQRESDFVDHRMINGYGSENDDVEDEEGWTKVTSKKQGKATVRNHKHSPGFLPENPTKTSPDGVHSPKLHWEIMRSVDSEVYRNIELEIWEETKKEQQQRDQTIAATIQFKKGDKCQYKHPSDEQFYVAIIDDIFDKNCKIFIPELKERKVVPFSSLKQNEYNSLSYRELSGYYKKSENGDTNTRGNEDQKFGRRRRPNRNRKGPGNEGLEKNQQEVQDEQSGRHKPDKNRRRRNENVRAKDEKNESKDREKDNTPQENGLDKVPESGNSSAFPSLPGGSTQPVVDERKTDVDAQSNSATFWSNFKTSPQDKVETHYTSNLPEVCDIPEDLTSDDVNDAPKTSPLQSSDVTALNGPSDATLYWQDSAVLLQHESAANNFDVQSTAVIDENTPSNTEPSAPSLDETKDETFEANSEATYTHDQSHLNVGGLLYTPQTIFADNVMENSACKVDRHISAPFTNTEYGTPVNNNENKLDAKETEMRNDQNTSPNLLDRQSTNTSSNSVQENCLDSDQQSQEVVLPSTDEKANQHPMTLADIPNAVLTGHITYSRDPDCNDLPKDMEILRHFYNLGFQTYFYNMNATYSGGQPLSPVFPVMSTAAPMYAAMHQPYQGQSMLLQQNMGQYPQMQQVQEENQHHNTLEERRDGSPNYKQNMPAHHSPQFHHQQQQQQQQQQHMAQAVFNNMNYGQMYPQRPVYPNFNIIPVRSNYPRYPHNKFNFNRQTNRKVNRYYRGNENNQQNVKPYAAPSGYGSDIKTTE